MNTKTTKSVISFHCDKCDKDFEATEMIKEWLDKTYGSMKKFYGVCPHCKSEITTESPKIYPRVIADWASPHHRRKRLNAEKHSKDLLQPTGKDKDNFNKVYGKAT